MSTSSTRDAVISRAAVVVVGMCVVTLGVTLLALATPSFRGSLGGGLVRGYVEGDVLYVDSAAYASARRTVVFFARYSCSACQASQSTMSAIVAEVAARPDVRVVMVTGLAQQEQELAFAAGIGIDSSRVLQLEMRNLRLRYVPAAVVTDATGRILLAREGLLTESDRTDIVLAAVEPVDN